MHKLLHLMQNSARKRVPLLPKFLASLLRIIYCCDISGGGLGISPKAVFMHRGLGCVLHENVVVGDNVKIYQNVTLGGDGREHPDLPRGGNHPVIKPNSIIYAGACVLGPVVVGEDSIVGANAVVLCDVPPHCIAVGVPAEIKRRKS